VDDYIDGLPDYLSDEEILWLGGDPEELVSAGVEPYRGNGGVRCWAHQDVLDWLGSGPEESLELAD
jgi:hypothetical protein